MKFFFSSVVENECVGMTTMTVVTGGRNGA